MGGKLVIFREDLSDVDIYSMGLKILLDLEGRVVPVRNILDFIHLLADLLFTLVAFWDYSGHSMVAFPRAVWHNYRYKKEILRMSPESSLTARGFSSLVMPPIKKMQLSPNEKE